MGLGRVLLVMLGLDSVREVTFLFRGPNRLTRSRLQPEWPADAVSASATGAPAAPLLRSRA
ncbi:hypothetical protein [Streptomyces aurantiogriseus]|uniref:hypothetical protein n=1 Tax=Streptomyces aurantiogriseus TaxID=66870 RepID=UPI003571029C